MMARKLELLAPAKNLTFGMEAINHGADAVYIGGPSFGARAAAGNSIEDIAQLVKHAHHYHAKVLVALNTILKDSELEGAQALIHQLYEAGADALIVQDLGVLQLDLPPIALHASTQLDNRTPEKVSFLEQAGFSRIVLARELSLEKISAISNQTTAELEFFIHGALCVSYSGQCYISHAITGRSANRGECAQLCRVPCTLETKEGQTLAKDQHLLSLKDMNQSDNLALLAEAGISSFKIEGRLKDLSYVKNVTAWYRQQLDKVMEGQSQWQKASAGRCRYTFTPQTEKTFNRGATDYFLHGRQQAITSFQSPKFTGESVGSVKRVGDKWIELNSQVEFNNGDGICFFNQRNELVGLRINRAEGIKLWFAEPVRQLFVGSQLFRNHDQSFEKLVEKKSAERHIAVSLLLEEAEQGLKLTMTDEQDISASSVIVLEKEPAGQPKRATQAMQDQLTKLGNTLFYATNVTVNWSQPWFVPASVINQLRRQTVEALELERERCYVRPQVKARGDLAVFPEQKLTYLGNVYNRLANDFYKQHGVGTIAPAYELNQELNDVSLMITKHCLRYSFEQCPKEHGPGFKPDPLVLKMGKETFRLKFDCKRCEMHVMGKSKQ
jgi:23S rRNA 5-hydroxycytidine C2501 synthase